MFEDPAFWVAVAFVLFVAAIGKKLITTVAAALDKRSDRIRGELDEARRLREEAQGLLAQYQRKQREALKEAETIVAQAREDAERLRAEAKTELETSLARRRDQAVEKIARAEAQAIQDVREAAADLAFRATRRLIGETVDPARDAKLVAETVAVIGKKLH
jgi:F-type H+-transporting ATPase subunit b